MAEEEEEEKKEDAPAGAPAWVMTFADLMSLLMCFFVLLLAFSEMDVLKYKQVAGSMANAFGVQNEIKIKDIPKGTSIIAQEFSAGQPKRTAVNELRQITTTITHNTLDIYCDEGKSDEGKERPSDEKAKTEKEDRSEEVAKLLSLSSLAQSNAKQLREGLNHEITQGNLDVKAMGTRVIIRIRERGSFDSGSAKLKGEFIPIMATIRTLMKDMEGVFSIEGHTDDIPIKTHRFRSNWDLSAARAASVAQELLRGDLIDPRRVTVMGYADNRPLAPNKDWRARARNRRVEIVIEQDKSWITLFKKYYENDQYIDEKDQTQAEETLEHIKNKSNSDEIVKPFKFSLDEIF